MKKSRLGYKNKNDRIAIGPKFVKSNISRKNTQLTLEGRILDVGRDFVNIIDDYTHVTTVLTNKITKVIWKDHKCRSNHLDCHKGSQPCKCVKFDRRNECVNRRACRHHNCHHFENDNNHCANCCYQHKDRHHDKFTCFCDHVIPFCDKRVELRLAGLTDRLPFELLKHKGCFVLLETSD